MLNGLSATELLALNWSHKIGAKIHLKGALTSTTLGFQSKTCFLI